MRANSKGGPGLFEGAGPKGKIWWTGSHVLLYYLAMVGRKPYMTRVSKHARAILVKNVFFLFIFSTFYFNL